MIVSSAGTVRLERCAMETKPLAYGTDSSMAESKIPFTVGFTFSVSIDQIVYVPECLWHVP